MYAKVFFSPYYCNVGLGQKTSGEMWIALLLLLLGTVLVTADEDTMLLGDERVCVPLSTQSEKLYPCELDDVKKVEADLRAALEQVGRRNGGSGGVFSSDVHVFCHPQKGRGLIAAREGGFNKSEILIRLPLVGLVTSQSLLGADKLKPINHLDALALAVLEQKKYGTSYYVDTLPIRLCEEDLKAKVKDEDLLDQALGMKEAIRERGEELVDLGIVESPDEYERVLSVVQSRVFVVPMQKPGQGWVKAPSLVMIADMMNLSLDPNMDCATNEQSTHFECYATRDIRKDEELTAPFVKHIDTMDMTSFTWFHYGFEFSQEEIDRSKAQETS